MNRAEIKNWAKSKIKGHIIELLVAIIVVNVLSTLTIGEKVDFIDGKLTVTSYGISLGIFFYFVTVGFAYYMTQFIKDKKHEFMDLFSYAKDFVRIFVVNILQTIFVFLWCLLLIIPGIIKSIAYALVPLILSDAKYKDLGYMETLRKSEDMMRGHKMDLFVFELSFIGWHILAVFTLFLLEIWILPYYYTAKYKFLNDIKDEYEKTNK